MEEGLYAGIDLIPTRKIEPEPLTEHAQPVVVPRWLVALCRWFATLGGLVLVAMMLMTVASIARRSLLGAPIPGDFELVEIGSAIVVSCFLPWCQITGGNVLVDFFTMKSGPRTNHLLEALGDLPGIGFVDLARGLGCPGQRVTHPAALDEARTYVSGDLRGLTQTLDRTATALQSDLSRLTERAGTTMDRLDAALAVGERALASAEGAFGSADRVMNSQIEPVVTDLRATLARFNDAIGSVTEDIPAITARLRNAADSADAAFVSLRGGAFLENAAWAKITNTFTNLGALIVFSLSGEIIWGLGIALAVANMTSRVSQEASSSGNGMMVVMRSVPASIDRMLTSALPRAFGAAIGRRQTFSL